MIDYIGKKRAIADSLAKTLNPISTEDLIGHILPGLDSSYGPFVMAYMMCDTNDSLDDVAGMLLLEESRLEQELNRQATLNQSPSLPINTLALIANRSSPRYNSGNGSSNSPQSNNRSSDNRRKQRPLCQIYNKVGHEAVDCWQRDNQTDYPSRRPNPRASQRQAHYAGHHSPSTVVDPACYFDIGATDHVTNDFNKLNGIDEYHGSDKLQVGNDNNLSISHIGSASLHGLRMPSVLVVPKITKNHISVSKLTSDNPVFIEFWNPHCHVKSVQGKTLLNGDVDRGLYRLSPSPNKERCSMVLSGVRTIIHGWHHRLAHPHFAILRRLTFN